MADRTASTVVSGIGRRPYRLPVAVCVVEPSDVAWVTVDENLIGENVGATVAAVNLFRLIDGDWRMVLHHGSPVAPTGA